MYSSHVGFYFKRHRRIGLRKQDHRKVKGNIIFITNHCKSQALFLKISEKLKSFKLLKLNEIRFGANFIMKKKFKIEDSHLKVNIPHLLSL
jgi:hypothetical protein